MDISLSHFNHLTPVQIRFNDADSLGHINNAVIQEYFDLGRINYFDKVLGDRLGRAGQNVVIVSYTTDFLTESIPYNSFSVYTKVTRLGQKSFNMLQWLVKSGNSLPNATCNSVMAGFNRNTHQGLVIPDEWRDSFNHFEKSELF
ncbi:acyl-CoA thioesterase [Marinilabiliaceae bacterium ANBcel2]|nr:acyl-CoA thioesterase [Marinilabiliaceae bacterium ANBcel2]